MGDRQTFPREIYRARGRDGAKLSMGARLTLSALWSFARWWDEDEIWVFPSFGKLAKITDQDIRSVKRQAKALAEAGLIVRQEGTAPGGGKFDGWVLVRPVPEEPPTGDRETTPRVTVRPPPGVTEEPPPGGQPVTVGVVEESPKEQRKNHEKSQPQEQGEMFELEPPEPPLEARVIAYMREQVRDMTGDPRSGPRDTDSNRKFIRVASKREKATFEDWKRVIDAQRRSVERDEEKHQWLCLATVHTPKTWARLISAPAPRGHKRTARHAPSNFDRDSKPEKNESQTRPWKTLDEIPL